jgi:hypothetical protein
MLQILAPRLEERDAEGGGEGEPLSLHAAVTAQVRERAKFERLCRYIRHPTVAVERLSLTAHAPIRYTFKPPPYRDGTTHVVFEPEDCTAQRRFGRGASRAGKDGLDTITQGGTVGSDPAMATVGALDRSENVQR